MMKRKTAMMSLGWLALGYGLAYSGWPLHLPPICVFRQVTGLPCPSCGLTHACCALARGNIAEALSDNLAVILAGGLAVGVGALIVAELVWRRPLLGSAWRRSQAVVLWGGGALLLLAWVVNLAKWETGAPAPFPTRGHVAAVDAAVQR